MHELRLFKSTEIIHTVKNVINKNEEVRLYREATEVLSSVAVFYSIRFFAQAG
jgi:hypothetical protein